MKKLLFILISGCSLLQAMQKPEPVSQDADLNLIVKNKSTWSILIQYKTTTHADELLERTVPKNSQLILNEPHKINFLRVVPHGDWWGLANIEKLSAGTITLPDEASRLTDMLKLYLNKDILLEIDLPKGFTGNFSSFIIKFEELRDLLANSPVPASRLLEDVFPMVKDIIHASAWNIFKRERQIEARHFLSQPEHASQTSIDIAYESLRTVWESMLDNGAARDKAMAEDVITFMNAIRPILDIQQEIKKKEAELKEKNEELQKLILSKLRTFHRY